MRTIQTAVVAVPRSTAASWVEEVTGYAEAGLGALLVPDTLWTTSTFPALAAAATVPGIRLRSWVAPATLRTPAALIREVQALQQLSGGRFELGIGPGRPEAEADAARLGATWGTPGQRLRAIETVVDAVRAEVDPAPPIVITAGGPRLLSLAGRIADRVALALPASADEAAVSAAAAAARAERPVPLSFQVVGVGDRLPSWIAHRLGQTDLSAAAGVLRGGLEETLQTLRDRADRLGLDELVIPAELLGDLRDVLAALRHEEE